MTWKWKLNFNGKRKISTSNFSSQFAFKPILTLKSTWLFTIVLTISSLQCPLKAIFGEEKFSLSLAAQFRMNKMLISLFERPRPNVGRSGDSPGGNNVEIYSKETKWIFTLRKWWNYSEDCLPIFFSSQHPFSPFLPLVRRSFKLFFPLVEFSLRCVDRFIHWNSKLELGEKKWRNYFAIFHCYP